MVLWALLGAVPMADDHAMRAAIPSSSVHAGPWFRRHPTLAVVVGVVLYGTTFGLRLAVDGTTEAITLLFVLPIALFALAFGARAGWASGAAGVLLLAAWATTSGASLTPLGWVTRVTPMLLLGGLVGTASDRLHHAAEADRQLAVARLRQREAAEINDSINQRLAAAKWALEAGNVDRGVELVAESIETAESLVADLLRDDVDRATARPPGDGLGGGRVDHGSPKGSHR